MAQGLIGGATSYDEQSPQDILADIEVWLTYTEETNCIILQKKQQLEDHKYWNKVSYDFQGIIEWSLLFFRTITFDLNLIKSAIIKNCITEKEVNLLFNIGKKSFEYNGNYALAFKGNCYWHEYNNPDFRIAEEMYCTGRDYFVTLQDAANAAHRLENYMDKSHLSQNTLNIMGPVSGTQIQQGTVQSSQTISAEGFFDYEAALKILLKMEKSFSSEDFVGDFGDKSETVKAIVAETIEMVNRKEKPSNIKSALNKLKDLAMGVTGSLIASGIYGLLAQLPI